MFHLFGLLRRHDEQVFAESGLKIVHAGQDQPLLLSKAPLTGFLLSGVKINPPPSVDPNPLKVGIENVGAEKVGVEKVGVEKVDGARKELSCVG